MVGPWRAALRHIASQQPIGGTGKEETGKFHFMRSYSRAVRVVVVVGKRRDKIVNHEQPPVPEYPVGFGHTSQMQPRIHKIEAEAEDNQVELAICKWQIVCSSNFERQRGIAAPAVSHGLA